MKIWRKGNPCALHCCWQQCKLLQTLWKTVWRFLKQLENQTPRNRVGVKGRGWRVAGEIVKVQKVQTSSYKINPRDVILGMVTNHEKLLIIGLF